jgi:hypothetical protein
VKPIKFGIELAQKGNDFIGAIGHGHLALHGSFGEPTSIGCDRTSFGRLFSIPTNNVG